ncbi:MAG: Hydrogen peroxide-inducible genes activator [Alphaproteobacteria bacterium ADurb.BinA280]|jgi:LysR family hydrogen peroxide-inducible transcriptional activator|nr:DNA-binding transcriptional regulator OxyR [Xanthomonadales bacterium]MCC6506165.1 DNA-binding transcriptional regulator OxyR [Aquimonas sp.]OPZ11886.1 MAG: Hydrogen peroxide-inducible genes activator [Alphaproteobacteria bacterium ADurb.BinA280]
MNLRDLRYLVALADLRHFGRAADACHVSQPTLSTQIKKIEDELGVTLVERAPRNVLLTEVGVHIAQRARGILAEVEQIKSLARMTKDPEAGTLRLGIFPTLGPYLLPHVVSGVRSRFPRLELLLIEEKTEVLLQQLHDGRVDCALLALPLHHEDQLHAAFLFEEPFVLAVPKEHPLATRTPLRLRDIGDERLLLLDDGHCLRDQALDVCHLAGASEKDGFRATSLETLRQMVAAGVGVTLLPVLAVQPPVPRSPNMQLRQFSDSQPSRQIAMVWRKSAANGAFLQRFAELIRDLALPALQLNLSEPAADPVTSVTRRNKSR